MYEELVGKKTRILVCNASHFIRRYEIQEREATKEVRERQERETRETERDMGEVMTIEGKFEIW